LRNEGAAWQLNILGIIGATRGTIGRVLGASDVVQDKIIARQNFSPLTAV